MALLFNKRAHHDFAISKTYQAGVMLVGSEVKSLRLKSGSLMGSYIKPIGLELFLINCQISPYKYANNHQHDPKRSRKLLLKKKEIFNLIEMSQKKGWSLVPIAFMLIRNHIKLEFGLGRGKKVYEKRELLKKRSIDRSLAQMVKQSRY